VYSPAYRDEDVPSILAYASMTFNSISQWERFYSSLSFSSGGGPY